MLVVRNVFRCKPGEAKHLVKKFKDAFASMPAAFRAGSPRVLTDSVGPFWTVVIEWEAKDLADVEMANREYGESAGVQKAMEGYMTHVEGGHREIFKIE